MTLKLPWMRKLIKSIIFENNIKLEKDDDNQSNAAGVERSKIFLQRLSDSFYQNDIQPFQEKLRYFLKALTNHKINLYQRKS